MGPVKPHVFEVQLHNAGPEIEAAKAFAKADVIDADVWHPLDWAHGPSNMVESVLLGLIVQGVAVFGIIWRGIARAERPRAKVVLGLFADIGIIRAGAA